MAAVEEEPNVHIRALVWLALLTGCRRSELCERTWDDVDLEGRTLTVPRRKGGDPRVFALSAPAVAILEALPKMSGNDHLIPSPRLSDKPLSDHAIDAAWKRIRQRAGVKNLTLHDFRRSVSSMMQAEGASLLTASRALGHASIATTEKHYSILPDDATRDALEAHGQRVLRIVNGGAQ